MGACLRRGTCAATDIIGTMAKCALFYGTNPVCTISMAHTQCALYLWHKPSVHYVYGTHPVCTISMAHTQCALYLWHKPSVHYVYSTNPVFTISMAHTQCALYLWHTPSVHYIYGTNISKLGKSQSKNVTILQFINATFTMALKHTIIMHLTARNTFLSHALVTS